MSCFEKYDERGMYSSEAQDLVDQGAEDERLKIIGMLQDWVKRLSKIPKGGMQPTRRKTLEEHLEDYIRLLGPKTRKGCIHAFRYWGICESCGDHEPLEDG